MSNDFLSRTIFVTGLISAAMTAGCGDRSPSGPTPSKTPSPVVLSVSGVSPDLGSSDGVAEIRVAGAGFQSGATLTLGGVAATVKSVLGQEMTATTPTHVPEAVDVVVTNPDGERGTLKGGYTFAVITLRATPSLVTSGEPLTLEWVGPGGRGCNGGGDWIAIYPSGAADITGASNGHSNLWYTHLCGATDGVLTATAPDQAGQYEFRFMIGDTSVARSSPLTVSAPASPSIAAARSRER